MTTNLVVADKSRTEKTICLAVSPSLKSYGIPGRARLFEVVQKVKEVNKRRICMAPGKKFAGASVDELYKRAEYLKSIEKIKPNDGEHKIVKSYGGRNENKTRCQKYRQKGGGV